MKKTLLFLPLLLWLAVSFTACEEVSEPGKYDNWRSRNDAFVDSLAAAMAAEHFSSPLSAYVTTAAQADAMELGKLYAIKVESTSSSEGAEYVYCRKLVKNPGGERPNYVGYHSTVNAYYYGTFINCESFDGNFEGYTALDANIPLPPAKAPTEFDSYTTFDVSGVIPGWTWALQYMTVGERWMVYVPWYSAYGSNDQGLVKGFSTLAFDIVLDSFEEE